ncbi:hypothetical protein [Psychroserpens mesophilus]|uniref:hypothetical protein n=1 Tax=Psychroserpens mesophilus TaxID=325473 RepID=UPI003D64CF59
MQKKLVIVCLLNFLVAALMGLALRFSFVDAIGINYRFLTHAHSHVAMLGWVYLMLYVCIVHYFVPEKKAIYNRLFWFTQFAVIGMMLSFPFQGYGAVSITFSTLHILCSYYFVYLIWKHHNTKSKVTTLLLRASLLLMLLSTLGVWCLGPAVGLLGKASAFYQIAIQHFLHFQFNGWFLCAVIAIFFHLLNIKDSPLFRRFFKLLVISTILTLAMPVQWFAPHLALIIINALGVVLQVFAIFYFFKLITSQIKDFHNSSSKLLVYSLKFAIFCLVVKSILQVVSIIPEFAEDLYLHRNFVIGFIHLLMLGVITGFLFAFILKNNLITFNKISSLGVYSFLIGFVLTETILLIQGIKFYFGSGLLSNYYLVLFLSSILLPLGVSLILLNTIKHKTHASQTTKTT